MFNSVTLNRHEATTVACMPYNDFSTFMYNIFSLKQYVIRYYLLNVCRQLDDKEFIMLIETPHEIFEINVKIHQCSTTIMCSNNLIRTGVDRA